MSRHRAYDAFPETCPKVDSIMDEATERIKNEVTGKFRDALIEAYDQVEELEGKVEDLETRVEELEGEIEDLNDTVSTMEKEAAQCEQP